LEWSPSWLKKHTCLALDISLAGEQRTSDSLFLSYARKKQLTGDQPITRYGLNEGHLAR